MLNENTNLVSKHQLLDYVSKREFNDFVEEMRDFREMTEVRFDSIEARIGAHDKRFDSIEARLSSHDKRFDKIDRQFDDLKEIIRVQIGAVLNKFQSDLSTAMEYFQNLDKSKVDRQEFDLLKNKLDDYIQETGNA